jgi:hypothetical protein
MTVQDVKIVDLRLPTEVAWAREVTLNRLVQLTDQQNDLLSAMAKVDRKDNLDTKETQKNVDKLTNSTSSLTDALGDNEDAVKKSAAAQKAYSRSLKDAGHLESINDLRNSMNRLSRSTSSPADAFEVLTDKMAVFGGRLTEKTGSLNLAGRAVQSFTKALTVASFSLGAFAAGMDPFRQMLDSGISFGGSLEQMNVVIGRTGLGLQEFTNIALQYSQQISGIGATNFSDLVRSVQDTTREFGRYGQTPQAQAESIAAFMEILSSGGSLYSMSVDELQDSTNAYLREQAALTKLTGISRKRQEDEQKQLMARTNVQLAIREMEARGDTEGAGKMRMMLQQVGNILGPEMASAITGLQMGIIPQDPSVRRLLASSGGGIESLQRMASGMATSTPEQVREQALAIGRQVLTPDLLRTYRIAAEVPGSLMGGAADLAARMGTRMDGALGRTTEQRAEVEDISSGRRGVLDRATTAYQQAAGDMARITGDLRSTIFTITQQLQIFSTALPALAGATGVLSSVTGGLASVVGQGVGEALTVAGLLGAGYMVKGMLARRAITAAAGTAATSFRPPALPPASIVPGAGTAGGAAGRMGMLGNVARMGGIGVGLGGLGGGAYLAASGESRASRLAGIGTSAAGGALTGAMIGSMIPGLGTVVGAGLGAGLGGMTGLMANLYGTRDQQSVVAPSPAGPAASQMSSLMNTYWGETSLIMLALNRIENLTAKVVNNTNRTANSVG